MYIRKMLIGLVLAITLASCGGNAPAEQPTPANGDVSVQPTTVETVLPLATQTDGSPAVSDGVATRAASAATGDVFANVPGYGTLESSSTEDPDKALLFDLIQLTRYGGGNAEPRIELEIRQNGSYTRNGVTGIVSQSEVVKIDDMLDQINFYGLQSIFMSLNANSSNMKYQLRVVRGNDDRTIDSEDGYMPTEYMVVLGEILTIGVGQ